MPPTERLATLRADIARAATGARRDPDDITLIAVTKTHPAEAILPLLDAGHRDFGENRVQEAQAKWPVLKARYPHIRLHLIGQLQSNKAREAVALFDTIHTLDRPSLLDALARLPDRPPTFVQVNLEGAAHKGGCSPDQLPDLLAAASAQRLQVEGLMCVPPAEREPAPWFALLATLADVHGLSQLSMGMSGDYETAIRLGATHVRVGSALFGERA